MSQLFNPEYSVIGGILLEKSMLVVAEKYVDVECFKNPYLHEVFQMLENNKTTGMDAMLVQREYMEKYKEDITLVLKDCLEAAPEANLYERHCEELKKENVRAQMADVNFNLSGAVNGAEDPADAIHDIMDQLGKISYTPSSKFVSPDAAVKDFQKYYDKVKADPNYGKCTTGYESLDEAIGGGWRNSLLYVVGARPGMGKTTFGLNVAENAAMTGKKVLFISLEMTTRQITMKRISRIAKVDYYSLINAKLPAAGEKEVAQALEYIQGTPLYMTQDSGLTISDIRKQCRAGDFDLIVIDYLGLISVGPDMLKKTKYEQVTYISQQLKILTREIDRPIIALAQLNRESAKAGEASSSKAPTMSQMRDSGSIEQDADDILLLHRPNYYKATQNGYEQPKVENLEIHLDKSRYGKRGCYNLAWNMETGDIYEKAETENDTPC